MGPNDKNKESILMEDGDIVDDEYIDSLIAIYTNPDFEEDEDDDDFLH